MSAPTKTRPSPPPRGPQHGTSSQGQHGPRHERRSQSAWTGSAVAPAAAGLATVCASTALTGVIQGSAWFGHILVAVLLVGSTGLALRSMRAPALLVGLAQLFVLLLLVTGLYTSHGIFGIFPGQEAFAELGKVLGAAGEDIRTGLPPVEGTTAILCLATIGIGLVAVIVDTLAVALAAPAAAGLVLLCLYAVPASLADEMLPWWTFTVGAAAFAVLIAVDGNHRHRQWRGRTTSPDRSPATASPPTAVVVASLALGLLAGATFTAIGTVGQLPFMEEGSSRSFTGGLGLSPMVELEGLLNDQGSTEVFRVEGLDDKRLMRAFTLDTYVPNKGWQLHDGPMPYGEDADVGDLRRAPGDSGKEATRITINPMNWRDVWLPIYGYPRRLEGIGKGWVYDSISGAVYSQQAQRPSSYTLWASLLEPSPGKLRKAPLAAEQVEPIYTDVAPLTPRVQELTDKIVEGKSTPFDKALAIWKYFISDGNFTYDTETDGAGSMDALEHFLLEGKRGFCAQFASSMAVMLRSEGIPARVAIGFTSGTQQAGYRSISTRDAHAWVEVYFGKSLGWVPFDPTPLAGGRGYTPGYVTQPDSQQPNDPSASNDPSQSPSSAPPRTRAPEGVEAAQGDGTQAESTSLAQAPGWARWSTLFVVLLAAAATAFGVIVARRTSQLRGHPAVGGPDEAGVRMSAASRWLPIAAAAGWVLSLGLLGWMVSWWLALLLVLIAGALITPLLVREVNRNRRLHDITLSRPQAPDAAWRELLDECADRGHPVPEARTVRETARRLASEFNLDADGRAHLRIVVEVLERSWYSPSAQVDPRFAAAFEGLRQSLNRLAPLPLRGRLLPTSVTSTLRR